MGRERLQQMKKKFRELVRDGFARAYGFRQIFMCALAAPHF